MDIQEIIALLDANPDIDAEFDAFFEQDKENQLSWVPNTGPQTDAYFSEADELFYGGSAGGGKSDLILGLATTQHSQSLILRRTNNEAKGLIGRLAELTAGDGGHNSQLGWVYKDKLIEVGGCQLEEDKQKYKGRAKDFFGFDEISDFTESQYTFITTWNRSAKRNQRCRIVCAGNPPTRPEGLWVLKRWAAWLDPQHPNPAQPGELRWYTVNHQGNEVEVNGRGPHYFDNYPDPVYARSRTFIPARLSDNPDLIDSGYQASLDALPPELRAAYRDGDFGTTLKDDAYQVIPTAWVAEAQRRWSPQSPVGIPMCSLGVDVAIAKDNFVIAPRYDFWYDRPYVIPGNQISNAKEAAGKVVSLRRDNAKVIVDVGGGWGADCYAQLAANGIDVAGYMGVKKSTRKSSDNRFTFANVRSEAIWKFREALDPSQPGGSRIALPPDAELKADLCASTYEVKGTSTGGTLVIESKEDVIKRLGRSPDRGDAVVMAWWEGLNQSNIMGGWDGERRRSIPNVNRGRRHAG